MNILRTEAEKKPLIPCLRRSTLNFLQRVTLDVFALSLTANWKCIKLAHSREICCRICVTSLEVSTSVTSVWPLIEWDMSVLDSFRTGWFCIITLIWCIFTWQYTKCEAATTRRQATLISVKHSRLTWTQSKDVEVVNSWCPRCAYLRLLAVTCTTIKPGHKCVCVCTSEREGRHSLWKRECLELWLK